jgi:tRNA (guanine37-N1)-methyltransferase
MLVTILTLFPDFFTGPLHESILKRAQAKSLVEIKVVNIRDYADDKHQTTDDRPFGGGPGMVMKVEPIAKALATVRNSTGSSKTILTSAKGKLFTQQIAQDYSKLDNLVIICGHYEGVDERVAEHLIDEEVRIGDYVLTGGEAAAAVITDAVTRLIPGVLGNDESNLDESHVQPGVLGFPQYTRPEIFQDWAVPPVLLTGDHEAIKKWREEQKKNFG